MTELGEFLKSSRMRKHWSLRIAASHTGFSNGYLSLIENGRVRAPSPKCLYSLAEQYDVSYPELMRLSGHPSPPGPSVPPSFAPQFPTSTSTSGLRLSDSFGVATRASAFGTASRSAGPLSLDDPFGALLDDLNRLSPEELRQVQSFVAGLRAGSRQS